ncbi:MAG TPA: ATP-binding protein, partial [Micromonosporaceae bacterium]|nr:ATP-binding protein [Micromonosporaceae bacterium]
MGVGPWPSPIGRQGAVEAVRTGLNAGGSVLVYGPAGIGKSTVLDAVARAAAADCRVLRAAAAEAEAELPYLALVDLFGAAITEVGPALPAQLRAALDAALLRSAAPAAPHDQLAVRLAVLEVLRLLAARSPVLVVLDDIQWVDEPSAGVLSFVARRLDGGAVRVLAAERVPGLVGGRSEHPTRRALCPEPCTEHALPPMTPGDVAELLRARFRDALPLSALARASAASGGNPLYAVELGRVLTRPEAPAAALDPLPVPGRLRQLLSARLAALPDSSAAALLVVAAAPRPTQALVARLGHALADAIPGAGGLAGGVAAAEQAGVVVVDAGGAVRFTHPLLREMVYGDAAPTARRAVHEQLAEATDDPVERARHLALARPSPDGALAAALSDAASVARQRGAPDAAAELARLAADRTFPDAPGLAAARRLEAARHAYAAGLPDAATAYATAAIRDADEPATRVRARLLLVDLAEQDQSGVGPLLDEALADAGDDLTLLAPIHLFRAMKIYWDGDLEEALRELKRAESAAEQCGDTQSMVEALSRRATMESRLASRSSDELIERAYVRSAGLPVSLPVVQARQHAAQAKLLQG